MFRNEHHGGCTCESALTTLVRILLYGCLFELKGVPPSNQMNLLSYGNHSKSNSHFFILFTIIFNFNVIHRDTPKFSLLFYWSSISLESGKGYACNVCMGLHAQNTDTKKKSIQHNTQKLWHGHLLCYTTHRHIQRRKLSSITIQSNYLKILAFMANILISKMVMDFVGFPIIIKFRKNEKRKHTIILNEINIIHINEFQLVLNSKHKKL